MKNEIIIPIASMTKIITSIAVLLLYEEGEFLLNDPIDKYIPELKGLRVIENLHQSLSDSLITNELKTKPTIRDLLRHTSGMVYSGGRTVSDQLYKKAGFRTWDKSLHDFIKKIAEIPLAFQPGEKWRYSYSHEVLGYFVEVISGIPLNQFCKKRIFAPLGMNNTGFFIPQSKSNQLTNLYHYKNEKLQIEDSRHDSTYYQLPNAISGGGGWWSSYGGVVTTVSDFYILTKMLLNYGKSQRKQFLGSENN